MFGRGVIKKGRNQELVVNLSFWFAPPPWMAEVPC
jgi:hypothetical protein